MRPSATRCATRGLRATPPGDCNPQRQRGQSWTPIGGHFCAPFDIARGLAESGAAVILVHHDTKAEGATPRGHSLLNGALDFALHVKKDEFGAVRATLTKNRNGTCDRAIAFRISTVALGVDEDGDDITAALVDELSGAEIPRAPRLPAAAKAALDVLKRLMADRPGHSPDMSGFVRVSESDWRQACVSGRQVSASDNAESRTKAFARAYQSLVREGVVHTDVSGLCGLSSDLSDLFEELP